MKMTSSHRCGDAQPRRAGKLTSHALRLLETGTPRCQTNRGVSVARPFAHGPRSLTSDGLTGSYSGPEVGFAEINIDLLEARFWPRGSAEGLKDYFRIADKPEVISPPPRLPRHKASVPGSTCSCQSVHQP